MSEENSNSLSKEITTTKFYAACIEINKETIDAAMAASTADENIEICINVDGAKKEMLLVEFMSNLGIDIV